MDDLIAALYIVAFSLFIVGLRMLRGPRTAVRGNHVAAAGMAIAVIATLLDDRIGDWPLIAVGVIGLAIFLERFYTIVIRSKINGRAFIERVIQLVRAGKVEDAIKLCTQSNAVLPDMGLLILRSRSRD